MHITTFHSVLSLSLKVLFVAIYVTFVCMCARMMGLCVCVCVLWCLGAKLPCCAGLISEPPLGSFMKTYGQGESPLPGCIFRGCQLVSRPSLIPALIYSSPPGKQQPTPASGVPSLQPPVTRNM